MKDSYNFFANAFREEAIQLNEALAKHTYMKVGGPADLFFIANSIDELTKAVKEAIKLKIPYFILGGGSNILVGDKGFRGLVIKNRAQNIAIRKYTGNIKNKKLAVDKAEVEADSGALTNLLVRRTIQEGLAGLEYFLGVPGTIGGAIYNNSHYHEELIGNFVEKVLVLDKKGYEKSYLQEEMLFSYDYSILHKTKEVVLKVTFRLRGGDSKEIWKKAEKFVKIRSETQPLGLPSSGCMFKNPTLDKKESEKKAEKTLSAGELIDYAGLKGTTVGGARVSEKHANFIVNTGGATTKDILNLINLVQNEVKKKFKVKLEMEVVKVGEL